jgi:dihydropteroate synthase
MFETVHASGLTPRLHYEWRLRDRALPLGARTLVMGVLNVTPDSFYDGGLYSKTSAAVEHGLRLLEEGADILDIGGESTRPGAALVGQEEELARVLPVLSALRSQRPDAVLSIDTSKAGVAHAAVEAGADIVNDVSGLMWDNAMAATCAGLHCGVVVSHSRGSPDAWARLAPLPKDEVVPLVRGDLHESLDRASRAGIAWASIVIDPGFGFGKRGEENYWLLAQLPELAEMGRPILAGLSRKSFLGPPPAQSRLAASIAAAVAAVLRGAHIVRAHDVKQTVEAVAVADALLRAG